MNKKLLALTATLFITTTLISTPVPTGTVFKTPRIAVQTTVKERQVNRVRVGCLPHAMAIGGIDSYFKADINYTTDGRHVCYFKLDAGGSGPMGRLVCPSMGTAQPTGYDVALRGCYLYYNGNEQLMGTFEPLKHPVNKCIQGGSCGGTAIPADKIPGAVIKNTYPANNDYENFFTPDQSPQR